MKIDVFTAKGVKGTAVEFPKDLTEKASDHLVAQAIRVFKDAMHPGVSKIKTRSEVVASKRKIYRQKGTGRARHGALSAPIFVGGGKAHGPKGVKRELTLPKNMRRKALKAVFNMKLKDKTVFGISNVSSLGKTKDASQLITKIVSNESRVTVALSTQNKDKSKFFRNIKNVDICAFSDLNAYSLYFAGTLFIDTEAFKERKETKANKAK